MSRMIFSELHPGDRFVAYKNLYTKLDHQKARKHSQESSDLLDKGYGYIGDPIVSFDPNEQVRFVPAVYPYRGFKP